jgi:ribonuclease HII
MRAVPNLAAERVLWREDISFIAGIDEVGRGPLAGPVAAGAVVLPRIDRITTKYRWLRDVRDSKQLSPEAREELSGYIWEHALAAGVAFVSVTVIDRIGIAEASRQAWLGAIAELAVKPAHLLLDAFPLHACRLPQTAIINGDAKIMSIACASIIAKVARDFAALDRLGPCSLHRRSFSPVKEMLTPRLPL